MRQKICVDFSAFLKLEVVGDPVRGRSGKQSSWLDLGKLGVDRGVRVDALENFNGKEGKFVVLPAGDYVVQVKATCFGSDRRVARIRVFEFTGNPALGSKIGVVGCDTGMIALCDQATGRKMNRTHIVELWTSIRDSHQLASMIKTRRGNIVVADSGFGDGEFPIFELRQKRKRIGLEIEFIKASSPYPFEVRAKPVVKESRGRDLHWRVIEDVWDNAFKAMRTDAATARRFFATLTRGQRAALAIDIFNKMVLHTGGVMDVFFTFRAIVPQEIRTAFEVVGAKRHLTEFEKLLKICAPVLREENLSRSGDAWAKIMDGLSGYRVRKIEEWFRKDLQGGDAITKRVVTYIKEHPEEFPRRG